MEFINIEGHASEQSRLRSLLGGVAPCAALLVASIVILYKHTRPFVENGPAPVTKAEPAKALEKKPAIKAKGGK